MSALKKAFTKVVSHTRSSSKSSSVRSVPNGTANGDAQSIGHMEKARRTTFDETNANGRTAAEKQQAQETNGRELKRPDSLADSRQLSFTELKQERRAEREVRDEAEYKERKERMKKAHDEVRVPFIRNR